MNENNANQNSVMGTYDAIQSHQRFLGAIPLSSDILAKANIGLWAFELDEGKPPRMYVDDTMLGLIGLDHQIPPEETYHAWYDYIDEDCYGLVADAVEKMTNGEHAEVQYPWHNPNGPTMVVRCGGVRNFEYKVGVRIEGTHQDVTELIHFDEEEQKRVKRQAAELQNMRFRGDALAFVADHDATIEEFMEFFGDRIIEIANCDQVIFRNMDGYRIVRNAKGVDDIPQEICSECPFSKFEDDDIYGADGVVLMNDCSLGCNGVKTHEKCPAKSSIMQRVYTGGKLAGLLTLHYLNEYHTFTENGVFTANAIATYLGLLLGRISAKSAEKEKIAAESANKAKTEFLFNMSHDIRTPMNAIMGFTNMAIKYIDDKEKLADCLAKTQEAGDLLLTLINSILDMSRIESGNVKTEENVGDVCLSFANIESTLKELADLKGIDLSFEIGDIKDRFVYADYERCSRIFVNITTNAIKYTKSGGYVKVRCEQVGEAKDGYASYKYTFEDNGIGMSEEFQKHVFEQFSREENSTISGIQGSGLGLALCKSFVELMNGTIGCESKQGVGSTFTVILPFRLQSSNVLEYIDPKTNMPVQVDGETQEETRLDFKGKLALLVEDNELNREIAVDILEDEGLFVETAEDGSVAVKLMKEKGPDHYDFILMDIQMPIMGGYEATELIRKMYPDANIPIIALSANAFAEDREASIAAGMNDHVAKPINTKELFNSLGQYLK